jgi:hypothetical protein
VRRTEKGYLETEGTYSLKISLLCTASDSSNSSYTGIEDDRECDD